MVQPRAPSPWQRPAGRHHRRRAGSVTRLATSSSPPGHQRRQVGELGAGIEVAEPLAGGDRHLVAGIDRVSSQLATHEISEAVGDRLGLEMADVEPVHGRSAASGSSEVA